jgi:hypothetical protein
VEKFGKGIVQCLICPCTKRKEILKKIANSWMIFFAQNG